MFKVVKEDNSFVRDMQNNAILNVDNDALTAYKKRKNANMQLRNDVEQMKNEINEIKNLLISLIDK